MSAATDGVAGTLAAQVVGLLGGARWFAGKGRRSELVGLTPLPWLSEPGGWPAVRCEVAEVRYLDQGADGGTLSGTDSGTDQGTELYQLALSYWPQAQAGLAAAEIGRVEDHELGPVVAYDAMRDPQACRLVLQRLREQAVISSNGATVTCRALEPELLSAELEPRMFAGQQSNTSVMYGDVAMLKLFRRLEVGHNLDIEVHESLSRSGVGDVARLYGWVESTWPSPSGPGEPLRSADLAMVVEKLSDAEDGWQRALDTLSHGQDFAVLAGDLGRGLAEIHAALRQQFGASSRSGAEVSATMASRLDSAMAVAPALGAHRAGLRACFDALIDGELTTQRVHGDFHLGQTLLTPDGWKIIDFEGEPVKTLAERRAPDSVWRDVAGMLRSFDYAAASVPDADREWAQRCGQAFLQGYAGGELSEADQAVLRAYVADKAIYEVVYEVRARPDWVDIPLRAVEALAAAQPKSIREPAAGANR